MAAATEQEIDTLQQLLAEEKLAHDVYVALANKWNVPVFGNISAAETRHQNALTRLANKYSATTVGAEQPVGEFDKESLQALYDELVEAGSSSLAEAYKVGAKIEEMDIADLREAQAQTTRSDMLWVYQNLERASRNHLRAFAAGIKTAGESYVASHLTQEDFDTIAAADWEPGPGAGRGVGRRPRNGQGRGLGPGLGPGQGRGRGFGRGFGAGQGAWTNAGAP